MALEQRTSRLEGVYEQVDGRMEDMNRSIESLRTDTNRSIESLRADTHSLRSEMNSRFNNLYILMGGMWATMVAGFVALFLAD